MQTVLINKELKNNDFFFYILFSAFLFPVFDFDWLKNSI